MAHDELVKWETFRDEAYYDMWCVRPTGERRFEHGFHLVNGDEAKGLCRLIEQQAARIAELEAALERAKSLLSYANQDAVSEAVAQGNKNLAWQCLRAALENTDGQ